MSTTPLGPSPSLADRLRLISCIKHSADFDYITYRYVWTIRALQIDGKSPRERLRDTRSVQQYAFDCIYPGKNSGVHSVTYMLFFSLGSCNEYPLYVQLSR